MKTRVSEVFMKPENYRNILDTLPHAYALHQMIFDENNNPVDYVFLYVNHAFENMTGLKKEDILNQPITKAIPETVNDQFDWITTYGKVVQSKLSVHFKRYSSAIKKWFDVTAFYTENDCFATTFFEVTEDVQEKLALQEMINYVRTTLNKQTDVVDYQLISNVLLNMSGLNFNALLLVDEANDQAILKAYATHLKKFDNFFKTLKFDVLESKWPMDILNHPDIANKQTMTFNDFT